MSVIDLILRETNSISVLDERVCTGWFLLEPGVPASDIAAFLRGRRGLETELGLRKVGLFSAQ